MRKKLSLFLIAVGLLLSGAGGWEAYSATRTPDVVPADAPSREAGAALAQKDPNAKESGETPKEKSDANTSSESKEKQRKHESEAPSPGESTSETVRSANGDGGGEQKTSSSRPSGEQRVLPLRCPRVPSPSRRQRSPSPGIGEPGSCPPPGWRSNRGTPFMMSCCG